LTQQTAAKLENAIENITELESSDHEQSNEDNARLLELRSAKHRLQEARHAQNEANNAIKIYDVRNPIKVSIT
jgi:hypothetical protein